MLFKIILFLFFIIPNTLFSYPDFIHIHNHCPYAMQFNLLQLNDNACRFNKSPEFVVVSGRSIIFPVEKHLCTFILQHKAHHANLDKTEYEDDCKVHPGQIVYFVLQKNHCVCNP